jgi:hypothetical protein
MTVLPNGAGIGGVTILAILVILALWQRAHPYSIETSVDIDATPQQVWATLVDFESYPEWNPTLIGMSGEVREGARLSYRSASENLTPTVRVVDVNRELRWETHQGVVGVFDGDHSFTLEELPGGGTRFTQSEQFRGIAVLFATADLHTRTAPSFHVMNGALRDRVEGEARG